MNQIQAYTPQDTTRRAMEHLMSQIARVNGVTDAERSFTVAPTAEQRLEAKMQEEVGFLTRINVSPVRQMTGNLLGMGVNSRVGSRRSGQTSRASRATSARSMGAPTRSPPNCSTP